MPSSKKNVTKPASKQSANSFSEEERSAMRERAKELRSNKLDGEQEVLAKIAAMAPADRVLAERIHAIVRSAAPMLAPKTWYGMPAYAKDGVVVCFFQDARKFKARYATLGFNGLARLDEGNMWPTSFALIKITPADEKRITALVKKAVS